MYVVRTWASHALRERSPLVPTLWATFSRLGLAIEAREAATFPIVDVLDVGEPGRCPRRPTTDDPHGHRFDVQAGGTGRPGDARCMDCGAWQDELYLPGTYIPRPPDDDVALLGGKGDGRVTAASITRALRAERPGLEVLVAQTGGGVATIYLGPPRETPDGPRHWLAIGPGAYWRATPGLSTFHWDGLSVGADDQGESPSETPASMGELVRLVMGHCECNGCASWNTYHGGLCAYCIEACDTDTHTPEAAM